MSGPITSAENVDMLRLRWVRVDGRLTKQSSTSTSECLRHQVGSTAVRLSGDGLWIDRLAGIAVSNVRLQSVRRDSRSELSDHVEVIEEGLHLGHPARLDPTKDGPVVCE